MSQKHLTDLEHLSEATFQAELAGMQDILTRETALRRALKQLSNMHVPAQDMDQDGRAELWRIRAGVAWQAWQSRELSALNRELALCLAQKERGFVRVRRLHARWRALHGISSKALKQRSRRQEKQVQAAQEFLSILRACEERTQTS